MEGFFQAESVAVVGVSNSPGNLGRFMAANLMEFQYQGYIHLVGPRGGAFFGHRIHRSVSDIDGSVDLATVLVPAPAVPGVLRDCGEKGIGRVVVQSAGFRELGEDRAGLEEEVLEILEEYGMRMIGPNCLGVINRRNGLAVPFLPLKAGVPVGRVSVISQSGGVGATIINELEAENIGLSKFASIGNKLDVDEVDLLRYLVQDEETEIIYCYLEGISDGRKLMEVICGSKKTIIVHKSNNGRTGSAIARSHSASLSTDDLVVESALAQCGAIRVREIHQAMDCLKAFLLPAIRGNRLAVMSRSGGHAVITADAVEEYDFRLPAYPDEFIRFVQEHSRASVISFQNPLDLGDIYDVDLYAVLVEKTLARDDIDGMVFIHNYQGLVNVEESRALAIKLGGLLSTCRKPIAACIYTTKSELDDLNRKIDYPLFGDPREGVRALATVRDAATRRPLMLSSSRPEGVDLKTAGSILDAMHPGPIPADRAAEVLAAYRIPLVPWKMVENLQDALHCANELGYPVVLKTARIEVIHKSDIGGVYLDIQDEPSLESAFRQLMQAGPPVMIQKMVPGGLEWLVGGRQDGNFGPVVVTGPGGIYVEVLRETVIRVGPVSTEEAGRMLDQCRGSVLMSGLRGRPTLDRATLMDLLVRISWLLHDFPRVTEVDINPVGVFEKGCLALDWRAFIGED